MITNVIEEAIRELHISDEPTLYKRMRRWARRNIKHETTEPIDVINWPKGCLLVGLMHQAILYKNASTSRGRAVSIRCAAEVKDYFDYWAGRGAEVSKIDDCLAGEALLLLAEYLEDDHYLRLADGIMDFLFKHDTDAEGSLPYRPGQKNGQIFADGVGMAAPFAIHYGLKSGNEDAIELGIRQISNFLKYGIDGRSGLPWHVYSLACEPDEDAGVEKIYSVNTFGAIGWGRALGWISFGIKESMLAMDNCKLDTFSYLQARKSLDDAYLHINEVILNSYKQTGVILSLIQDSSSKEDVSASAMCAFLTVGHADENASLADDYRNKFAEVITDDGKVNGAQGECMGIGLYSDLYGSYPWSVGMVLCLFAELDRMTGNF